MHRRHGLAVGDFRDDLGLGQQHAVGVVLDGTEIRRPRPTVVAIAIIEHQIAAAVGIQLLTTAFCHQHADAGVLAGTGTLGDEYRLQLGAIIRQPAGIGHPLATAQRLETSGCQGIEFGEGVLLVEQLLGLQHAGRRRPQAQPADEQGHQQRRPLGIAKDATITDASRREHRHLAIQVHPAVGQENAEKHAQRHNQHHETGYAKCHDGEQHTGIQLPRSSLRKVLDEAPAHDNQQQHATDRGQRGQHLTAKVSEYNHTLLP